MKNPIENMTKDLGGFTRDSVGKEDASTKAFPEGKVRRIMPKETFEPPPMLSALCTYISYAVLIVFGHIADFLRRLGLKKDKVCASGDGVVSCTLVFMSLSSWVNAPSNIAEIARHW